MAACGSLQHIFDKPLPESPKTIFDSLSSWNHMNPLDRGGATTDDNSPSSFTELFGELHFKEHGPESVSSSSPPFSSSSSSSPSSLSSSSLSVLTNTDLCPPPPQKIQAPGDYLPTDGAKDYYRHSDGGGGFSSMNSESLSMCTEGLGFESFYDVEELKNNEVVVDDRWETCYHRHHERRRRRGISFGEKYTRHQDYYFSGEVRRSRINGVEFPPPISSIGRNGKPGVCFRSFRSNGRFILKEVRIPVQEFLHACREDGRLKLRLIQSDDEPFEDDDDDDEEEQEEEGANGEDDDDDDEEEGANGEDDDDDDEEEGANGEVTSNGKHDEYHDEEEEGNGDGKDENRGESP